MAYRKVRGTTDITCRERFFFAFRSSPGNDVPHNFERRCLQSFPLKPAVNTFVEGNFRYPAASCSFVVGGYIEARWNFIISSKHARTTPLVFGMSSRIVKSICSVRCQVTSFKLLSAAALRHKNDELCRDGYFIAPSSAILFVINHVVEMNGNRKWQWWVYWRSVLELLRTTKGQHGHVTLS